jgi:hypothetical protein
MSKVSRPSRSCINYYLSNNHGPTSAEQNCVALNRGVKCLVSIVVSPHDKRICAPHIAVPGNPQNCRIGRGYRVPQIYLRTSLTQLLQRRQRR